MMREEPIRILFVFAWLAGGSEENEVRLLARALDPASYRIDAVACFRRPDLFEHAHGELEALGVDVDPTPCDLSFEDTVGYLAGKIPDYDIVVSCQNVADIYPALERLNWRPPLVEHGALVSDALAGPKHFTARYVGANRFTREAAASRMKGREAHAVEIPAAEHAHRAASGEAETIIAAQWRALFARVLREAAQAPAPRIFASALQGGFECSTHRRQDGRRLDLIAATRHDLHAAADYRLLSRYGMRTVRDGLRWHLIETSPGRYDWSSFLPMLRAAHGAGTQVIWDLMHYGWPDDLDIWSPAFVDRFARYAAAAARLVHSESGAIPFYCPVNEVSFHSWAGADVSYLNPFAHSRGFELKAQLARAAIAAMRAILEIDPRARFVHCEPTVNVVAQSRSMHDRADAQGFNDAQYQAFDMISGRMWPQLGGEPRLLDIVGLNFYQNNQWVRGGERLWPGDAGYKRLRRLLARSYARYGRPLLIAETGTEGDARAAWFESVVEEVDAARAMGIPVEGVCLYPIINHPGWDNDRACPSGLLSGEVIDGRRSLHVPLAEAIVRWQGSTQERRVSAV